jgi:hypothetical protein
MVYDVVYVSAKGLDANTFAEALRRACSLAAEGGWRLVSAAPSIAGGVASIANLTEGMWLFFERHAAAPGGRAS